VKYGHAAAAIVLMLLTGCAGNSRNQGRPSPSLAWPSVDTTATATEPPTSIRAKGSPDVAAPPPRWQPAPGATWQWQLSGRLDITVEADVYDVDLFDTGGDVVRRLHAHGRRAVCYFSAGTWEPGRPDSRAFPAAVRGQPLATAWCLKLMDVS
jgi:hypothetical protein